MFDGVFFQYVANKARVIVKAVGDFDFNRKSAILDSEGDMPSGEEEIPEKRPLQGGRDEEIAVDIASYSPKVVNKEWFISELDLEFISCGCYILGTGGGGSPYPHFIRLREMMRKGAVVRVMDPHDLTDDAVVACGGEFLLFLFYPDLNSDLGEAGSPTVGMEKLPAGECVDISLALVGN